MTLLELLQAHAATNTLPMHMPGHKRNTDLAAYLDTLGAALDITEIDGFGNLHDPEGILAERMTQAATLWGSKRAWWLIGGSTAGLLAAIDAATQAGDKVLLGRNCHKSVYNGCMLCRLHTEYIAPAPFDGHGFADVITPAQVDRALAEHPDTRLVILTSPTYEGLVSDIAAISNVVHSHGAVLLVDEAHGAHLGLHDSFPPSAVTQGADIVVQSLHKTLPSLTQTAILHLCSNRVDAAELGFRLSVYQTSSPSYLLMASIDSCVQLLTEQGSALMEQWQENIRLFYSQLSLSHLRLPLAGLRNADPSKLLISTAGTSITGTALAARLREEFAIETEMSTENTVLCMTGMGDTPETLLRLAQGLNAIDCSLTAAAAAPILPWTLPQQVLPLWQAMKQPTVALPIHEAEGHIAGDFLWAYPPGIPLLTPGERIDKALLARISTAKDHGVSLHGAKESTESALCVLKNI